MVRAGFHRLDGRVHGGVGRQEDDDDVGIVFLDLAQDGDAVDVRELVVEEHEVDALVHTVDRLVAGRRLDNAHAVGPQALRQRPPNQLFIVGDEDGGHCYRSIW